MISTRTAFKPVGYLVIICFLLACAGPARKNIAPDQFNLTPIRARTIDWQNKKVRFSNPLGFRYNGYLLGWTDKGFIVFDGDRPDTLEYESLSPSIRIQTGKQNTGKGAEIGLYTGLGLAGLNLILVRSDSKESDMEGLIIGYYLISTPAILAASVGLGALLGATSNKYDRYNYDPKEFANYPWITPKYYEIIIFKGE